MTSALLAAPAAASATAGPVQFLTFLLGSETCAIGILAIKEIIEYGKLTEVPMTPPCVRGVINLRGAVVPVVDLMARFGRASSPIGKRSCIVIVELVPEADGSSPPVVGVLVDAVHEVIDLSPADIEAAPSFGTRLRSDFVQGVGKVKGGFVILLDVGRVLSLDEIGGLVPAETAPVDR